MEVQQNAKKTKEAAKIQRQKTAEMPMRKIELLEADKASLKSEILNLKGDITRMQEEAKSVHKQMSQEIASTQKDKEIKVAVSGEANEAKTNIWRLRAERAEQAQKRAEEAQNRTQREWDRALKIELDIVHHAAQKRQALACGESAAAARKAVAARHDSAAAVASIWCVALTKRARVASRHSSELAMDDNAGQDSSRRRCCAAACLPARSQHRPRTPARRPGRSQHRSPPPTSRRLRRDEPGGALRREQRLCARGRRARRVSGDRRLQRLRRPRWRSGSRSCPRPDRKSVV